MEGGNTYTNTNINTLTMHTYKHTHPCRHNHMYAYTHMHIHPHNVHTHTHIHPCIHIIHACAHAHIHTHTQNIHLSSSTSTFLVSWAPLLCGWWRALCTMHQSVEGQSRYPHPSSYIGSDTPDLQHHTSVESLPTWICAALFILSLLQYY